MVVRGRLANGQTLTAKLQPGGEVIVKANVPANVLVDGRGAGHPPMSTVLAEGKHTITLRNQRPFLNYDFTVQVRAGERIEKALTFGSVDVTAPGVVAVLPGAPAGGITSFSLPAGKHSVALRHGDGREKLVELEIVAGQTVKLNQF